MPLPEQVRKQVEQADQVVAEMKAAPGTPTEEPPIQGAQGTPQASAEVVQLKPAGEEEPWEARYKALQGIFDTKLPQMQGELKNARQLLDQQRQMIIALQGQLQQTPPAAQPPVPSSVLTETEIKDYTPEFFSMMQRWLAPQVDPIRSAIVELQRSIPQAVQQLSSQVQNVTNVQALTREEKFFKEVGDAVPAWEQLNTDQRFLEWLGVVDELTGITRHAYLSDARANLDARRAIAVFSAFLRESGVAPSAGAPAQKAVSDLDRQVTMESTKRSAAPNGAATAKTYSPKDLTALYDAYRRGAYKGRDAEFQAEEQKLLLAINEGRYSR